MSERLDAFERAQLARAERTIRRGLATFVAVGEALLEIRDQRLYRETHGTFEEYCRDRWALSKTHGNRLVQAAQVVRELAPTGAAPTSERQARELTGLLRDPAALREVWGRVVASGRPTAARIREAVRETVHPKTSVLMTPEPPAPSKASRVQAHTAPGLAGEGAPAAREEARAAGDARTPEPPAPSPGAGAGGPSGSHGATGSAPPERAARPEPEPQPASPRAPLRAEGAGPECGGPEPRRPDGDAAAASPLRTPVAEGGGGTSGPLLTHGEIHEVLTDELSPHYLDELGLRIALVAVNDGTPVDVAVARALRLTGEPGRLPERAKAVVR
ncbi:hypothetical protein [Actinomadura nitritigenes]|uniref:hypothetical protein n=1 Tax=Actinomadura nitritigenes TaxID=134602 RepID=UPI003D8E1FC6